VLVDCMRGLCDDDKALLRRLNKAGTPWKVRVEYSIIPCRINCQYDGFKIYVCDFRLF
jgi:hypothetical protein